MGDRVRFWRNRCCDFSLDVRFPLIFGIAAYTEVMVGVVRSGHEDSTIWNVHFATIYRIGSKIS